MTGNYLEKLIICGDFIKCSHCKLTYYPISDIKQIINTGGIAEIHFKSNCIPIRVSCVKGGILPILRSLSRNIDEKDVWRMKYINIDCTEEYEALEHKLEKIQEIVAFDHELAKEVKKIIEDNNNVDN